MFGFKIGGHLESQEKFTDDKDNEVLLLAQCL